jgi:hypothetical protein
MRIYNRLQQRTTPQVFQVHATELKIVPPRNKPLQTQLLENSGTRKYQRRGANLKASVAAAEQGPASIAAGRNRGAPRGGTSSFEHQAELLTFERAARKTARPEKKRDNGLNGASARIFGLKHSSPQNNDCWKNVRERSTANSAAALERYTGLKPEPMNKSARLKKSSRCGEPTLSWPGCETNCNRRIRPCRAPGFDRQFGARTRKPDSNPGNKLAEHGTAENRAAESQAISEPAAAQPHRSIGERGRGRRGDGHEPG